MTFMPLPNGRKKYKYTKKKKKKKGWSKVGIFHELGFAVSPSLCFSNEKLGGGGRRRSGEALQEKKKKKKIKNILLKLKEIKIIKPKKKIKLK